MKNIEIDHGKPFDWGRASREYARYRDIYPPAFYERILGLGLCQKGQKVLDLGTGTGVLPRNLYSWGAEFTGVDISENQIAQAERLTQEAGMKIAYRVSPGEELDFPEETCDVVTACQCFQYFDRQRLFPELHRVLKPEGRFCILFMAWLPEESPIAAKTEELVLRYNPSWTGAHMTRALPEIPEESKELFDVEERFGFDLDIPFTRETWNGRIRACRGIGASSLPEEEIARFEEEHRAFLAAVPEPFTIPHFATVLLLRKK